MNTYTPPPLHPNIGPQFLVLDGVEIVGGSLRMLSFDRKALEKIWGALHELNEVASNPEKYPPLDEK